jgi:hypothetical protein
MFLRLSWPDASRSMQLTTTLWQLLLQLRGNNVLHIGKWDQEPL